MATERTLEEKKEVATTIKISYEKSELGLPNLFQAIANLAVQLVGLEKMKADGEPLPIGVLFANIDEWIAKTMADIKSHQTSIANLDVRTVVIEALQHYIDTKMVA